MKQETRNFILFFIVLLIIGGVLQYIENSRTEEYENKINELKTKNEQLEIDKLMLSGELCNIKAEKSDKCDNIKARIELIEQIKGEVKRIYSENFGNN